LEGSVMLSFACGVFWCGASLGRTGQGPKHTNRPAGFTAPAVAEAPSLA